ncbi:MAG TPA: hypothetical protein VGC41_27785, partial [Kofleriaceae bacterium]
MAGVVEGAGMDGGFGRVATAGFLALAVFPALVVISVVVRGLWAAWSPRSLALIEADGGAPRFAGWLGAVILMGAGVAWVMWQGTWLLARWTAFKPIAMSFAMPVLALVAMVLAIAVSRPLARLLCALSRMIDRRWQQRGHRSLLTPARLIAAAVTAIAAAVLLLWKLVLAKRLGPLDTSVLLAPALAVIGLGLAHVVWARWPRTRMILGPIAGVVTAGVMICALVAWKTAPSLTLEVWGDRPLAGLAIDTMFDLDKIRDGIDLAEIRPVELAGAPH